MLIPDNGASNVMYSAAKQPHSTPVYGATRGRAFEASTTDIRIKEINSSLGQAITTPPMPGTVAT